MEKSLRKEVVGQDEAVSAVADAIRLNRSGLSNQDRPIASFLFVGPTGTGKTLLAKALAKFLFDSSDAMLRIDASEYSEKHAISRLIGSVGLLVSIVGCSWTCVLTRPPFPTASRLRRSRVWRPAHRVHPPQAVQRRPDRRDREGCARVPPALPPGASAASFYRRCSLLRLCPCHCGC